MKNLFWLITGTLSGMAIAFIDTRPNWNDDGITVFMILIVSVLCSYFYARRPWLIALAIGIWVPVFNIILANNFGSVLALAPAFIGAYTGYFFARSRLKHA